MGFRPGRSVLLGMAIFATPVNVEDPINAEILKVSEDRIAGFLRDPLAEIARRAGVDFELTQTRIRAMLENGTIRRVRQTLLATNLAHGALVAWQIPAERLDAAFEYMSKVDPFSGHVVIRTADAATPGSNYRLWTTLKVPQGYSIEKHARFLRERVGAEAFRLMPAERLFALGVGHIRRRGMEPGSRAEVLADVLHTEIVQLSALDWQVLVALKREFETARTRARSVGRASGGSRRRSRNVLRRCGVARGARRNRPFLDVPRARQRDRGQSARNPLHALFHWQVPIGREIDAGREVGRHHIMTHAYWREGGPEFRNVNVMGVAHGLDKAVLLEHKAAIDAHLREAGIDAGYTNVFWGGRSEIKPSEISPFAFAEFHRSRGVDPDTLRV